MEASREIFWQIPFLVQISLYSAAVVAVLLIGYAVYKRYQMWMLGKPDNRFDNPGGRIGEFIKIGILDGVFHRRFFRDPYPGIMHFLIFVGCCLLFVGAGLDFLNHYVFEPFHAAFIHGPVYMYLGGLWNIAGLMVIIGLIMAFVRRYIQRPKRLNTILDDGVALLLILIVVISGFFLQGFRMIAAVPESLGLQQPEFYVHPEWGQARFVGFWIASMFSELPEATRVLWYQILWYSHVIITIGAVAYIILAWEKLTHILISPVNVLFKTSRPKGALSYVNLETAETYGIGKIEDFSWKQIFDLDACTNCGRCQDRCPAYLTEKPLSPRKVVQDLKTHWLDRSPALLAAKKTKAKAGGNGESSAPAEASDGGGKAMVGGVITEDEIWSCTTCRACQDVCPVFIEHIDKIVDMRRHLVLDLAQVPETGEAILKCIEARGHSCKGTTLTRTDWTTGLDIKQLSEDSNVEYMFFAGCAASLEERSTKIAIATAKILKAAGTSFGILGAQEMCCGEPARRLGNEYLFQTLAAQNVELFKSYNVKKIITMCPHCFNTLKNEYPQFDGNFEVIHHSTFISRLIDEGKIKPAIVKENKITYHDSCYLGRHNDIYEPQRHVLRSISKLPIVEMERSKNNGFCCGAGGGRFWMEERIGKRISETRIDQVIETGAEIVASACPYCVQMFTDAIKAKGAEETLKAFDIAELVAESLTSNK
ncbi:MAG: heterodisulfide reductase-related iron-sulfur binding cluster [Dehalococcoidia bacterium]|nr:heterodisulfide reductase-related iron-sulfur binding cluster [Dehalococcoidia bacterium]MDD5493052.1 heterodisulfide reductase-related iron-sulfur binding cluster [Dehalococcoidia bacterium]